MKFVVALLFLSLSVTAESLDLTKTASKPPAFRVTCAATATKVTHALAPNWTEVRCGTVGATPVFFGDSTVTSDASTSTAGKGWPICTNAALCFGNTLNVASNNLYCKVASGTVVVTCQAVRN